MRPCIAPKHLRWREALFPQSSAAIQVPCYFPGEAGFKGTIYNVIVWILNRTSALLNLLLILPMLLLMAAWFLVSLPLQLLRFFVTPAAFGEIARVAAMPAQVLLWIMFLPVKICNLLTATVVYVWGPKT